MSAEYSKQLQKTIVAIVIFWLVVGVAVGVGAVWWFGW
jgi:hypothetical protein